MQKSSTQLTLVLYRRSFWNNEIEDDQCDEYERLIKDPESLDISRDREIAVNSTVYSKAFDSTNPIYIFARFCYTSFGNRKNAVTNSFVAITNGFLLLLTAVLLLLTAFLLLFKNIILCTHNINNICVGKII